MNVDLNANANRIGARAAQGAVGAVVLVMLLAGISVAARPAPARGRCVGMFLDAAGNGARSLRQVPADATNLVVHGSVPCREGVMAWSAQGPYRVFEDGTVEFLAAPIPPCPGGDYYVWVAFPN